MRSIRLAALGLLVLAGGVGCARSVSFDTPGPTYSIQVENSLSQDMIVSYDDGSGPRTLGTVAAGRSERFVVATDRTTVTITAANSSRTRTAGPYSVQLTAGTTPRVTLGG